MKPVEGSAPRKPIQVTAAELDNLIACEYGDLSTIAPELLVGMQNAAMKRLERAEKRSRAARGAPACLQEDAVEELKYAIAYAEELGGLELEAF